jgi:formate dehydrogenase iron-sulfur subunit
VATTLTTSIVAAGAFESAHPGLTATRQFLAVVLMVAATIKLLGELLVLRHRGPNAALDLKRTATLLTGTLADVTRQRMIAGVLGGVALPSLLLLSGTESGTSAALSAVAVLSLLALIAGELLERRLFFSAVSPPRMPGAVGG